MAVFAVHVQSKVDFKKTKKSTLIKLVVNNHEESTK